jgi:predicted nucleic acid-binding protein
VYLLDTNVVSETRKPGPYGAVLAWIQTVPDQPLHLSAVTVGEIQAGIEITRERDVAKALAIEAWLDQIARTYNVLPMDAAVFRRWAHLMHRKPYHHMEHAMIAATALIHGLTVVTRNVRDFELFGLKPLNPFEFVG